ncbi:GGDEF domain-containing protein [Rhodoferax fermentans]|uniref:diguanylate cyclase n=1 Tax=Rhodoferax fermentans TaxID=28066 RepID=A0A1T1ANJ7_RHOFE|nr:GGDEF domain-containing protein [Rhodoferax fermentans]MBK1683136.1 GGDEF domain-containing protein [Rhodoferax fermentans]OOV05711.1 GGDEF domain-containing protein [Rhodoferax fermentans]
MNIHLDLPTVILVYNTSLVAGALSIVHIRRHSCRPQGLGYLAAAYLLLALGSTVAWSGEYAVLPEWLWTHGSLLLGVGGYICFWVGVRQFSGRWRVRWHVMWMLLAAVLVMSVATGFPLQNLTRAGVFHGTAALVLAVCTFDTLRDRHQEPLPSRTLLAALLALSGGIYALRLVYIVTGTAGSDGFAWAFYVQMFCHFGIALAVATLSNERAEVRLELAALTDPLTGTGNRRWLAQRLPLVLPAHSAIAQLDIDRFKQINDRHGHAAGDQVLVAFARCLQEELRSSDLLARVGGEEFVIYLPVVTEAEALAIARRLCEKVAALRIEHDGLPIPVTVSIGLAWVHGADLAAKAWLQKADAALYSAKRAGRNRVVVAAA